MTDRNLATLPVGGSGAGLGAGIASTIATHRVLRNTYALLSLTAVHSCETRLATQRNAAH